MCGCDKEKLSCLFKPLIDFIDESDWKYINIERLKENPDDGTASLAAGTDLFRGECLILGREASLEEVLSEPLFFYERNFSQDTKSYALKSCSDGDEGTHPFLLKISIKNKVSLWEFNDCTDVGRKSFWEIVLSTDKLKNSIYEIHKYLTEDYLILTTFKVQKAYTTLLIREYLKYKGIDVPIVGTKIMLNKPEILLESPISLINESEIYMKYISTALEDRYTELDISGMEKVCKTFKPRASK